MPFPGGIREDRMLFLSSLLQYSITPILYYPRGADSPEV
jgi:hypothetical protein